MLMILAHDLNFGIGKDNFIPWKCPDDLKHFRKVTMGKDLIVGRVTATDLPPLKNRRVFIVSRIGMSIEDAINHSTDPVIIGGKQVYEYCLDQNLVTEIVVTVINQITECDTFIRSNYADGFDLYKTEQIDSGEIRYYKNL